MYRCIRALVLVATAGSIALPAVAQQQATPAQQTANSGSQHLSPAVLQQIVAHIALYPDELLSIVLPASTQALQIVEAQRFLDQHKANPSSKPPPDWDPSVVALLNYPDVVAMMNKDLDWTQQLGSAMIEQQAEVLSAIQDFRKKAYDAGNLKSDTKRNVHVEQKSIVVQSADPQVIYVPQYDPQVVVAPVPVGAPPAYAYSPPYPYYASPAATFATGAIVGATVGFAIGWSSHAVYTGNWGWGGGNSVNVNGNVNINNMQRANFNNRVTANRENVWHPDRNATVRQQNAIAARGGAERLTPSGVRSSLAARPNGGAPGHSLANRSPGQGAGHAAPFGGARPAQGANRSAAFANRSPNHTANRHGRFAGAGQGDARPSFQQRPGGVGQAGMRPSLQQRPGGAFAGINSGAQANRFSNRGGASLGSANRFAGGGGFGGGRFGGGGHGFRR